MQWALNRNHSRMRNFLRELAVCSLALVYWPFKILNFWSKWTCSTFWSVLLHRRKNSTTVSFSLCVESPSSGITSMLRWPRLLMKATVNKKINLLIEYKLVGRLVWCASVSVVLGPWRTISVTLSYSWSSDGYSRVETYRKLGPDENFLLHWAVRPHHRNNKLLTAVTWLPSYSGIP